MNSKGNRSTSDTRVMGRDHHVKDLRVAMAGDVLSLTIYDYFKGDHDSSPQNADVEEFAQL